VSALVLELQRDALDSGVPISDLLRKALVVARKLDIPEFEEWTTSELSGYPDRAQVPAYRIIRGEVKAWNPYIGMWIPMVMPDVQRAEKLSRRGSNQGVAELEALLRGSEKNVVLQMPFSKAIEFNLMAGASVPLVPTLVVPRTRIVGILDNVRNIVLNWSLRLEKDGIFGESMTFSSEEMKRAAEQVYNVTHFHGDVSGSQIQQFSSSSSQNLTTGVDVEALASFVERVRAVLPELRLEPEQRVEIEAELTTLAIQAKSPKPKAAVVRESLRSLRNVLEGTTGSIIASGILAEAAKLLGL
jgi:hypothetical protein